MIIINQNFDAGYEREVASTEEAKRLQDAIFNALKAYADYLDRHGLIWDLTQIDDPLKVKRLVADIDFRDAGDSYGITLEGGALDPRSH